MPLHQEWTPIPGSVAAIWKIEEEETFFSTSTKLDATHIRHPKRRTEHLAGRYLLQHLHADIPLQQIAKDIHGKPGLPGNERYFSVSHSFPYVAAIISVSEPVGIDIQVPHTNIRALAPKFLTEQERLLIGDTEAHIHLAWTAKEAAYKLQGLRGVDFKFHLPIQSFVATEHHVETLINCTLIPDHPISRNISLITSNFYLSIAHF